jgi:signal transduction histidine kinase/ActR/RegA family two-component response regulator
MRVVSNAAARTTATLHDVMNREVISVCADVGIDTVEELLLACDLAGVPVVDPDRRLVGYVTMIDLVRERHDRGDIESPEDLRWGFHTVVPSRSVSELMIPVPFELQESCSVATAIELMTARHLHHVPVVSDDGILVGIFTTSDALRYFTRHEREENGGGEAAEADRVVSLGFLAGGLAHQVNNALTPMRLTLGRLTSFELSRRPMSPERTHRVELLQDMREGVDRLERIVRDLTVFAHANDAMPAAIDLIEVLDAAVGVAAHEIRHRAHLVLDYGPVPLVNARAADLRQVFLNLLINAVHAIREGEAHLNEIQVRTWTDDDGAANVEIRDTGSGIPADALQHLFEPFFTTQPGRALGLGLALTRDLVTAHNGTISVDSVVGSGTAIRIALPAGDEVDRVEHEEVPSAPPGVLVERRRILIVDDDRPVAAAIALELREHDVVVAESGREALEILRHDKSFDVILCDLMMPEVSGKDVYEALRLIEPTLLRKVVLMTGGAFTREASEFLASVDAPLLEKPFEATQLRAIVNGSDRADLGASVPLTGVAAAIARGPRPGKES